MSDAGRPLTPYEQWVLAREEQQSQREQGAISEGMVAAPTNFLKTDQRRSWTVPAGVSQFEGVEDPSPEPRVTGEMRRQAWAEASRDAERMTRLSGSATNRLSARAASQQGWHPVITRDTVGRLTTSWERDDPGDREQLS